MNYQRGIGFWILISISILLTLLLLAGQTHSLINYDSAVAMGLQESVEEITAVGIAFAKGFAFGDTAIYIPLIIVGVIGLLRKKRDGAFSLYSAAWLSRFIGPWFIFMLFLLKERPLFYIPGNMFLIPLFCH